MREDIGITGGSTRSLQGQAFTLVFTSCIEEKATPGMRDRPWRSGEG